ncbi:MAG: hypothetical protein KJO09_16155, partial [Gammaproteobacteria bacterium]|nr:hypothetical protein [Gammaproteobacteria bacterium]
MSANNRSCFQVLIALLPLVLASCGGGAGGGDTGGGNPVPPPPPTQYGSLTIDANNAEILAISVALAEATLSIAQTLANEVIVFSSSSGTAARDCDFGGTATVSHDDADTSFSVSAGDTLTVEYDECYGELVDGEMTGTVELGVTDYAVSETQASLATSVDIIGTLRISDRVDPGVFSDVTAGFDMTFSLDPSENLAVTAGAADTVSILIDGTTEIFSEFDFSRQTDVPFAGAQSNAVDMEIDFQLILDSGLFGGSVTCQTDTFFTLVGGNVSGANVLCRGANATGVRTSGQDLISLDPEGDGTFSPLGTFDWNLVIDGFLREPSGLNLDDLFGQIATSTIPLAATDLFYDELRDRLVVTTSGADASSPNALVAVSLSQNTRTTLVAFSAEPSSVALSADGALIYVGFSDRDEIRKYDGATLQLLSTVNIDSDDPASGQYGVLDLAVSPVAPNTVAATFNYLGTGVDDVTLFVDDVQLPGRFRNAPGGNSSAGERLFYSADGSRIHSYYQPPPQNTGARDMVVDATGVVEVVNGSRFGTDLELAGGSLYSNGAEYDADTYVMLGTYGEGGRHIAVDPVNRRLYAESFDRLDVYELDRRLALATYDLGLAFDSVRALELAGNFLVMLRDDDLRVLDTTTIELAPAEGCEATALLTSEGDGFTQFACDVIDAIYDPVAERIYAAVTENVPGNGNSVAVIDTATEAVETYIPVPSNPKRLMLSGDGSRLYVAFAEVELLVAIDTATRATDASWQLGVITPRTGYNELDPRKLLQFAASPLEPDTIVALTAEAINSLEREFVAFRDGTRLTDELPASALTFNASYPYPRPVFDDAGGLYALYTDGIAPLFETLTLSPTGVGTSGSVFEAAAAVWWPFEVSVKGAEVYFAEGDVANVVNQTVERRFDYNDLPFTDVNAPTAVHADADTDDVWFLAQSDFDSTGLARFNGLDGSLQGADEFPFLI